MISGNERSVKILRIRALKKLLCRKLYCRAASNSIEILVELRSLTWWGRVRLFTGRQGQGATSTFNQIGVSAFFPRLKRLSIQVHRQQEMYRVRGLQSNSSRIVQTTLEQNETYDSASTILPDYLLQPSNLWTL
jgi:hypothetical protein